MNNSSIVPSNITNLRTLHLPQLLVRGRGEVSRKSPPKIFINQENC